MRHKILTPISRRPSTALRLTLLLAAAGCGTSAAPTSQTTGTVTIAPGPASAAAPASTAEVLAAPLADDPMAVTIHRLDNGLTVYISTDREQPRISAWIAVRAGGRHDPANSTGLAHYLEHMLFKGTEKLGTSNAEAERPHLEKIRVLYRQLHAEKDPARRQALIADIDRETQASARHVIANELDRVYTTMGASGMNAFTDLDSTRYLVELPSNRLSHWAALETERLGRPTFRLFLHELEAVYEEKNRSLDSPERRGYESLFAMAWPQHPYGTQTTIGSAEHLRNPAFEDMIAYFERWYVPNNMAIVLAGDVDAASALPVLRQYFGRWSPKPLPPVDPGRLPAMAGRQFQEIKAETDEAVMLGWQVPAVGDADQPALAMLDGLVGHGTAGMLQTALVLPHKVTGAGSGLILNREAGMWMVLGSAKDGQSLPALERMLLETVDRVKQGRFTDEDLAAIALDAEMGQKLELESLGARASKMAEAFVTGMPWAEVVARERNRRRITRQDVIRVANRYLNGNFAVLHRRKGKFQPPRLTLPKVTPLQMPPGGQSAFARDVQALPAPPIEPVWAEQGRDYQRARLPAGKLLSARNQRNDLFHLRYQFDIGQGQVPLLCYAMELQALSGAGELSAEALRRKLFVLGATIETWCEADESGISVRGVDENLEATVALLDLWFRQPQFSPANLAGQLETTLTGRKRNLEDPRNAGAALAEFAAAGPHSGYVRVPSNQQLAAARVEDLRAVLMAYPDRQHETLYFGPRSPEALAGKVAFGRKHRALPPRRPKQYRPGSAPAVFLLDRDTNQTRLDLAFTDGPLRRQDRAAALALTEYLSGSMGGVVMQELRETTGLVYNASASYQWGDRQNDPGALLADAQMQAPKAAEATSRLLALLRKAAVEGGRLREAKQSLEETLRITRPRPRRLLILVDSWDGHGFDRDPRPRLRAEIAAINEAQVAAFWRRVMGRPMRVAITGEAKVLDRAWLGKLGKVEEMKAEALFGYGPFPAAGPQARAGQ